MPGLRTIDVTVPHTLGVATAWERVLRWLTSGGNADANIKPRQVSLDYSAHRITLTVEAYGYVVDAKVSVSDSHVDVTSEGVDGIFPLVVGGIGIAETRITSQLTEALR